jgi:hypothetical protein
VGESGGILAGLGALGMRALAGIEAPLDETVEIEAVSEPRDDPTAPLPPPQL